MKSPKILSDLLYTIALKEVIGKTSVSIEQISFDSRKVSEKTLFVALVGTQTNGHQYINKSIAQGANAILCQEMPTDIQENVTYLKVTDTNKALAIIANNFYDNPSAKLKLVGITGTNGKTTSVTLLHRLFRSLQYNVGLISTIQYQINEEIIPATHTTPDALKLNALLAEMVEEGMEYCFMEVSSHAVVQHRITGLQFAGGVFSNLSHDHIGYHGSFKEYIKAKKGFFDQLGANAFALINTDDKQAKVMVQNTKAKKHTYALKSMADFKVKILENSFTGLVLNIDGEELHSLLIGEFNAYNLLAVYGTAILLGEDKMDVLTAASKLKTAEGRFDYVADNKHNVIGIVDYAHTPDALLKVLSTVNTIRTRNEQLITIIGCGGDRDRKKRPMMARFACEMSDKVILTSDNPRTEMPEAIIEEMETGVAPEMQRKVLSITSRREAIKTACMLAQKGDIIVLAGKGHEKYQEINGVKHPFDDKKVLYTALNKRF